MTTHTVTVDEAKQMPTDQLRRLANYYRGLKEGDAYSHMPPEQKRAVVRTVKVLDAEVQNR